MKTSKNKWRRRQQQSGRPVLLTFYVILPRRFGGGGKEISSHDVKHHHQHRRHHHLHGSGYDERRRRWNGSKFPNNRRADLLEYSQQLRALAQQASTTASTPTRPLQDVRHHRDTHTAVAVRGDGGQPEAVNRRLERAMSQQQIRQRCFGGDGWSWKRVLVLIFPISSGSHSVVERSKPRRPRTTDDDDSEKNPTINQKGWPAALLAGNLTVTKSRRDHGGFAKKLMSVFQKRSR